jgi:hypothetical protein
MLAIPASTTIQAEIFSVVSRSWWKSEKASRSGELSHNSHPLGGGCRRMTPWKAIARLAGQRKPRSKG